MWGAVYDVKAAIVATGTFLRGRIIIGDVAYDGGPDGLFAATKLTQSLQELGIELMRFKTGTPARVNARSIDFSKFEQQKGDDEIVPFSFETESLGENKAVCYLSYTNEKTHEIIKKNLHRSPLYSGVIEGVGPRYCPSIEDKIVRFADKDRHQIFIEPMGLDTDEMYVQGMSTSLPEDVQLEMYRTIPGMENVHVMRTAYAIEYDCIQPTQLKQSLEFKAVKNLYGAGQFNGSSGYEEAAAQGLIAGVNAVRKLQGKEPVILSRSQAYIGVLIDDLVTKGTSEPYRMMTARAEHRLLLRQDNADLRLTPLGYEIGLISKERYQRFLDMKEKIETEIKRLRKKVLPPSEKVNAFLDKYGSTRLKTGIHMDDLLKRPEMKYAALAEVDEEFPNLPQRIANQVEISIKYEGYIARQQLQAQQAEKLEKRHIPEDIDYFAIDGLRMEARQKLSQIRPSSVGQASRISGVSPADISVLLVYLKVRSP
jgi:tRNA uridine 5-carboxymethylaminomethyl modification enzyme